MGCSLAGSGVVGGGEVGHFQGVCQPLAPNTVSLRRSGWPGVTTHAACRYPAFAVFFHALASLRILCAPAGWWGPRHGPTNQVCLLMPPGWPCHFDVAGGVISQDHRQQFLPPPPCAQQSTRVNSDGLGISLPCVPNHFRGVAGKSMSRA